MHGPWSHGTLLAPLTKVGNLPFRRLCVDFGARVTTSEMAYASGLLGRSPKELALLRHHPSETFFGVQLAVRGPERAVPAAHLAVERGAKFIDLNCGCPIHHTVKRGMGAKLLTQPAHLERTIAAMVDAVDVPITVKVRLGWASDTLERIAQAVEAGGATAITIHGRTRQQRYHRAADWSRIAQIARSLSIPVVGNGDVLTWYEAEDRRSLGNIGALMVARGALIKPWIFQEIDDQRPFEPSAAERVAIYLRLVRYFKEYFRDDPQGRRMTMCFLPAHLHWFARYRPLPEAQWRLASREHPLLQTRMGPPDSDDPLDHLLADSDPVVQQQIADILWESPARAETTLRALAAPGRGSGASSCEPGGLASLP